MSLFFFNDTATTEIYTLSLHDALPILVPLVQFLRFWEQPGGQVNEGLLPVMSAPQLAEAGNVFVQETSPRSEEHTSELQSRQYLVCRLLLEQKRTQTALRLSASDNLSC